MRGAGVAAAGITGAALIGCGSDDEETTTAAPSGGSAATAQATSALSTVVATQAAFLDIAIGQIGAPVWAMAVEWKPKKLLVIPVRVLRVCACRRSGY